LPCGYSSYYWNLLTNPTSSDLAKIYAEISCRMSQVKATLLYQIDWCRSCLSPGSVAGGSSSSLPRRLSHESAMDCNISHQDARQSLCAPTLWYIRPLASALTLLMDEPPDCSGCLNTCEDSTTDCRTKWGCQHPQSNYTWNSTDETNENMTYQEAFWLSDTAIQAGIDALTMLNTDAQASLDWSGSNLTTILNQAKHAVGMDALKSRLEELKQFFLTRTSSTSVKMAFFKMWHWYQNVVDVCVHVVDSNDIDKRAIIGAQYYDKMSQIASRTFWSSLDTTDGTWSASTAYPTCNFQHPRMFGFDTWMTLPFDNRRIASESLYNLGSATMLHKKSIKNRCCNVNSYKCGEGEGHCSLNIDCGDGLICGNKNCLWSLEENCCMKVDARHAFAKVRIYANKVGYRNLMVEQ